MHSSSAPNCSTAQQKENQEGIFLSKLSLLYLAMPDVECRRGTNQGAPLLFFCLAPLIHSWSCGQKLPWLFGNEGRGGMRSHIAQEED